MYYILYLSSLCRRRRWPDPLYECAVYSTGGYRCTVRVNNRDYLTESVHETEDLAREAAAMHAYLICRNLSLSEGQGSYPPPPNQQYVMPVQPQGTTGGGWAARRGS